MVVRKGQLVVDGETVGHRDRQFPGGTPPVANLFQRQTLLRAQHRLESDAMRLAQPPIVLGLQSLSGFSNLGHLLPLTHQQGTPTLHPDSHVHMRYTLYMLLDNYTWPADVEAAREGLRAGLLEAPEPIFRGAGAALLRALPL